MSLPYLPEEIRLMILDALVKDGYNLARFAAVSRKWQTVVEPLTFARIRLTPTRIAQLDSMTCRNRAHIRYLWLCVELERYGCDTCAPHDLEDEFPMFTSPTDDLFIKQAIQSLFQVIGAWDPNGSLSLDISVYSTSDREHWFKYLTFEPDDGNDGDLAQTQSNSNSGPAQAGLCQDHDIRHQWGANDGDLFAAQSAVQNVFTRIMGATHDREPYDIEWMRHLRPVPAITRLVLRQQTRRRWCPGALAKILACLPGLCELYYEPWREWDDTLQECRDIEYLALIGSPAMKRLKRLSIFENFSERYVLVYDPIYCSRIRPPNPDLGRMLSNVSLNLESLSGSFLVDAVDFFASEQDQRPNHWPNLTSLSLTSQLLAPDKDEARITDLLQAAAKAALHMPKLEALEIWNGREHLAACFYYKSSMQDSQPPTIAWKGSWDFVIQHSVIHAWNSVVLGRRNCTIELSHENINRDRVQCHGDAMLLLELPDLVIRSISLRQIINEQRSNIEVEYQ